MGRPFVLRAQTPQGRRHGQFPRTVRHGSTTEGVQAYQVGVNPPRRAVAEAGAIQRSERRSAPSLLTAWSVVPSGIAVQPAAACCRVSVGVRTVRECAHGSSRLQKSTDGMRPQGGKANSLRPARPSAHEVRVNPCRKLRPGVTSRRSSGGHRAEPARKRRPSSGDPVGGRRSGFTTARRWRASRGWILGAPRAGPPRAGRVGSATGNASDASVPRTAWPNTQAARERAQRASLPMGGLPASQLVTASPKRGTTWGRSRRQRLCGASGESASTGACKRTRHRGGGEPAVRTRASASPMSRDTGGYS